MRDNQCGTRLVVIGNGPAGNWAAMKARSLDPACHVVLISEEEETEYSPCALPYYISGTLSRDKLFVKSFDDYARNGIEFWPGLHVDGVDSLSQRVYAGRMVIDYDRLILATGADVIVPPVDGAQMAGCFSAKTLRDADAIVSWRPRVVVVVGCGPIGLEVAGLLFKSGCQVHLYEVLPRVAQTVLDEPISWLVADHLRQAGIDLHLSEKVRRVLDQNGRVTAIEADSGIVTCDTVIWATGVRPRTQLAESAGLRMGTNGGTSVDDGMRTSRPEIFACGDCVESVDCLTGQQRPIMLWGNAVRQGIIAGANAVGHNLTHKPALPLISMDILGVKVCSAGLTRDTAGKLPDLTFSQIGWKGATYYLLMSGGRLVGMQALGRDIDPTPFQAFLSCSCDVTDTYQASNNLSHLRQTPWPMAYQNLKGFKDILSGAHQGMGGDVADSTTGS